MNDLISTTRPHAPSASLRRAMLLALGLSGSALIGGGGCADRGGPGLCADETLDYEMCEELIEIDAEGPEVMFEEVCFSGADGCDPCDADAITAAAIEHAENGCSIIELERVVLACGPAPDIEDCCYKVMLEGNFSCPVPGRPLLASAEQGPRVASVRAGHRWLASEDARGLRLPRDARVREALRRYWLECAAYEHASVASFARVSLQLLAIGAPARLLRAAQRAMGDEVRHAQLCFGLAAGYGEGTPAEAGPLRVAGSATQGMELEAVLREAIFDGALGEGAATIEAREGARVCEDPSVRALLLRIAEDEQRHALLAYQTVQWALAAHPRRAQAIVRACLREGARRHTVCSTSVDEQREDGELLPYGVLSPGARVSIQRASWAEVVAPVLRSMLAEQGAAQV